MCVKALHGDRLRTSKVEGLKQEAFAALLPVRKQPEDEQQQQLSMQYIRKQICLNRKSSFERRRVLTNFIIGSCKRCKLIR